MPRLEDLEGAVLEMKDTSELMVDLALSSVLYQNEELAEEVRLLEDRVDELYSKVQRLAIEAARDEELPTDHAWALVRLADATETIADAAREIADVVLRDVEPHPVLAASVEDSDVVFVRARVHEGAMLAGSPIVEHRVQSETGMHIFAVRRNDRWILGPRAGDVLEAGDVLLASGPDEGREKLLALCGDREDEA